LGLRTRPLETLGVLDGRHLVAPNWAAVYDSAGKRVVPAAVTRFGRFQGVVTFVLAW
jgi:hypothetical protein